MKIKETRTEDLDGALLVPMHIEAVLVGKDAKTRYADLDLRYRTLKKHPSGDQLEAAPFAETGGLKKGAHLHWLLPSALTHGMQQGEGGPIAYPAVPNRYLVTRLALGESKGKKPQWTRKSWLVESDIVSANLSNPAGSAAIAALDADLPYRYLGTVREYRDDAAMTSAGPHMELTAVASGAPYFAAYYPQCRNVFGFYDALSDVDPGDEEEDAVYLAYTVAGWYETPSGEEKDPLYPQRSADEIREILQWKCAAGTYRHTVCHGTVSGLKWQGAMETYPSGVPYKTDMLHIAAGHNTEEALAALVGGLADQSALEPALHSLLSGALTGWQELDGELTARQQIHDGGFRPEPSPLLCQIRSERAERLAERETPRRRIEALAAKEQLYGELIRARRQELYADWQAYLDAPGDSARARMQKRLREIQWLTRRAKKTSEERAAQKERLGALLDAKEALLDTAGQRYFQPSAPLLMLEGAAQTSVYRKLEDYLEEDCLPCRGASDIVTEMTAQISAVAAGEPFVIRGAAYLPECGYRLPFCMEALAAEAVLQSACGRRWIAWRIAERERKTANSSFREHIAATVLKNLDDPARVRGKLPNPTACHAWQAAFHPLILEWSVLFYPDPKLAGAAYSLGNWRLEETDYAYIGKDLLNEPYQVFRGRTVLSPHASDYLDKRLEKYLPEAYEWLKSKIKDLRILSQAMSGLNEQFLGRTKELQVPIWQSGGLDAALFEEIAAQTNEIEKYRSKGEAFYPVRAGLLRVENVSVIDSFGRKTHCEVADVMRPRSMRQEEAILGKDILLRPRIMMPCRLKADWTAARIGGESSEESPVYGFVWANLIDSALQIYTAAGKFAGSLQIVYDMVPGAGQENHRVKFRNPPGETRDEAALFAALEPELRSFVTALYKKTRQEPIALYEFLHVIDDAMWDIHTGHMAENSEIFAYLGHPVVLAGFSFKPDIKGKYPRPRAEAAGRSPLQELKIAVRLGDQVRQKDGAIGFYLMDGKQDYRLFHASGIAGKTKSSYIDYESTLYPRLHKADPPTKVTALMSPFGALHLITGLLPEKKLKLPQPLVARAMEQMYTTLFYSPFLTPRDDLRFFLPKAMEKEWSFLSYAQPGVKQETRDIKPPFMEATDLNARYMVREGWLKLNASGKKGEDFSE